MMTKLRAHYYTRGGQQIGIEIPKDCVYITIPARGSMPEIEVCVNIRGIVVEIGGENVAHYELNDIVDELGLRSRGAAER